MPPENFRRLVSHGDEVFVVYPGHPPFPEAEVPGHLYRSVFDFGCGCGRVARQLLALNDPPSRYVGIDIHRGMIDWCAQNLSAVDPHFEFFHHDVYNISLAPENSRQLTAPFPVEDGTFSLTVAHSVFTHLYPAQTEHYLGEISRILQPDGIARTTWFLFDKLTFPMMFDFQPALYINEVDPTNAVIYDWRWLIETCRKSGLAVRHTIPPNPRGFQWILYLEKRRPGSEDKFPTTAESLEWLAGSGYRTGW